MKITQLAIGVRCPIRRRAQAFPLGLPMKETHRVTLALTLTQSAKGLVSKRRRVPSGTEVAIQVSAGVSGAHVLSPSLWLYARKRVSAANCLVYIKSTILFSHNGGDFSNKDVTLADNEVPALAVPAPSKVVPVNVDPRESEAVATAR